jgi:hypothetical protein
MSAGFQLANLLAELAGGRNPQWEEQDEYTGAPELPSRGISLEDSVVARIVVRLREDAHRRRAEVTHSGSLDTAANYTVTVDGTAMTKNTPASVDALIIGLRDAILADATVGGAAGANQVVTAQALDASGAVTAGVAGGGNAAVTLEVLGTVEDDYTIAVSDTGTSALACTADAKTATVRFWAYANTETLKSSGTTAPEGWALIPDSERVLDYRGLNGFGTTNGDSRLYVEIDDLAGAGDGATVTQRVGGGVHVGPCVRETE